MGLSAKLCKEWAWALSCFACLSWWTIGRVLAHGRTELEVRGAEEVVINSMRLGQRRLDAFGIVVDEYQYWRVNRVGI